MNRKGLKIILFIFLLFSVTSVKAEPVNGYFNDDPLYKCVIDSYNKEKGETNPYTYNISTYELSLIKSMDCASYSNQINDLAGMNKLTGLTSLNISGNTFWGAKLTLDVGSTGLLRSNIILPPQLSIENASYAISDSKIIKIVNGVVTGLSGGSSYITMTGKVTGNTITEKYLIVVNSNAIKSSDNKLSSLSLSYGTIDFKSNINKYNVIVPNSISKLTISSNLESNKASYVEGYGPREVSLKIGNNTFYIKVRAEDGTVNTYTIAAMRSDGTDANNLLTNIELSVGKLDFKSEIEIYTLSVSNEVDKIEVLPITESLLATYEVSGTDLKLGENKITITVKAENGNEKIYQIIINREDYDSKNNYLSELNIKNYDINFNKDKLIYNINIKDEDKLDITAICERNSSWVNIIGNKNLKNGSKILVNVVDKDNVVRSYTINVNKMFMYNLSYREYIVIGEIVTIIILLMVVFRKKKKAIKKRRYINENIPNNKVCSNCGTINNKRSNTCYVCGRELK
jgi:hypothetical protein